MNTGMVAPLVLIVCALVLIVILVTLKAQSSKQSAHAGPVQNADAAPLPVPDADWQQGLHENSAADAEWRDQTERPPDFHEEIRKSEIKKRDEST